MKEMSVVKAVQDAIFGKPLESRVFSELEFDKKKALEVRDELLPLLPKLLVANPEAAQEIPEAAVTNLVFDLDLQKTLYKTGLDGSSLHNDLARPILLSQLVTKAVSPQDDEIIAQAYPLIAYQALESASVVALEKLVTKFPELAVANVPFTTLFTGSAELKSRLMDINVNLLSVHHSPPQEYLIWRPLTPEDDDLLLAAVEIEYIGKLVPFLSEQPNLRNQIYTAIYEICQRYPETPLANSIELVLVKLAHTVIDLFMQLDAQFVLVKADRLSLLAQLPPRYIRENHGEILYQLNLSQRTVAAFANLARDYDAYCQLRIDRTKLESLPLDSQLLIAISATSTNNGARSFFGHFRSTLLSALQAPHNSEETADMKRRLRENLSQWGLRF